MAFKSADRAELSSLKLPWNQAQSPMMSSLETINMAIAMGFYFIFFIRSLLS
jgi:hypothetical protein